MALGALGVRSFRFQWSADLLTSWAFEMETLILGWYVMVQTGSVLMLTLFGALQFLGTLAAPMFGVLGDRVGGRVMLCAMRTAYAALALLVLALALGGWLTPAWALGVAALAGIVRANDLVMRNLLIGETIPRPHVVGALGLSRATMDSARVTGALTGAGLSSLLGIGLSYVLVAGLYLGSLALTFGVARRPPVPDPAGPSRAVSVGPPGPSRWRDLKDGLLYVATTPTLLAVMLLALLINLAAYPVTGGLLPYVARHVYMVDATGLGWLAASFSFGSLLGSAMLVVTGGAHRPERSMLVHVAVWHALLFAFAHVASLPVALVVLVLAGFAQSVATISMMASLLAAAEDRFLGRVMGARQLAVYGLPVGLLITGALIERVGYRSTVSGCAALGLICTLLIAARWRVSLWQRPERQRGSPS